MSWGTLGKIPGIQIFDYKISTMSILRSEFVIENIFYLTYNTVLQMDESGSTTTFKSGWIIKMTIWN